MKIPSILLIVLLVFACVNPVAALDQQFDDTDEDSDTSIPNNVVWLNDPACTPGNPFGACAMAPAVIIAAPALVAEAGEVYLILAATGGAVLGFVAISQSPSTQPSAATAEGFTQFIASGLNWMRERGEHIWTSTFKQSKVTAYIPGSEEYHLLHKQLDQLEQDYNDAKEKGIPVPGDGRYKDTPGHRMDPKWQVPYSSQQLFHNQVDKDNGCPKQIRYYGKDGKAEMDIDFWHGEKIRGTHPFPHKHTWENGKRSDWITDPTLEELFKTDQCIKYLKQKYSKSPPEENPPIDDL